MSSVLVESGLQLFSRLNNRDSLKQLDKILFPNQLKHGQTVEISGNVCSGKTFLTMQLISNCILPHCTGGQNAQVIFIDVDHHFRVPVMIQIMKSQVNEYYESTNSNTKIISTEWIQQIIQTALDNLTIIHCYDQLQFRLTILSLQNKLLHNEKVALIAIDGIVTFYWQDRCIDNIWFKDTYLKNVLNFVQKYTTRLHKVALIYTISSDFMPQDKMYNTWSSIEYAQHRVNLVRTELNKFYASVQSANCQDRILNYQITETAFKWI